LQFQLALQISHFYFKKLLNTLGLNAIFYHAVFYHG
jgi:hypothetical protein